LSNPLSTTPVTPSVTIGGVPAAVSFSGLAPGFLGLHQVNVQVPPDAPAGDAVLVSLAIGGTASNTVTIAVQQAWRTTDKATLADTAITRPRATLPQL